jgi:hypothetical protein
MIVEVGTHRYEWLEKWASVVDNESGRLNGRTHGVQVSSTGEVIVFCQAEPSVLFFDSKGQLLRSWGNYPGAHGLTLTVEDGTDYLWLADQDTRQVVKTTLDGEIVQSIEQPPHPAYESGAPYVPTWAAVNEERWGGNGDVWITDGYGSSLVHRFDKSGKYQLTLDGSTGAGKFSCPHGIAFDTRNGGPQLLVADRSNHRIQVFGQEGDFVKEFGSEILVHPDCFSVFGDLLLVPELYGRVALLDGKNNLIGYLGRNDGAAETPGWPNLSKEHIQPGKFSSPHGGTFDIAGNIYIVEWIVGGRIVKLATV